jgi:hypothetical protein
MNTLRAYMGADTALAVWVRQNDAKADLTGDELSVVIYPYGRVDEALTLTATQSSASDAVRFTITEDDAARSLQPGPYRFVVLADSAVVSDGLLEMV